MGNEQPDRIERLLADASGLRRQSLIVLITDVSRLLFFKLRV